MPNAFTMGAVSDRGEIVNAPLRQLYDHWRELMPDSGGLPRSADIRLEQAADAQPHHWWFDAVGTGTDFVGRSFGEETIRRYRIDLTGRPLADLSRYPVIARVTLMLRHPFQEGRPFRFWSETSLIPDTDVYDVEALSLPLADGEGRLHSILGGTVFNAK